LLDSGAIHPAGFGAADLSERPSVQPDDLGQARPWVRAHKRQQRLITLAGDLGESWRLWPPARFFAPSPLLASPLLRPARSLHLASGAPFLPSNALIDHETRSRNEPATISAAGALPWGRI
jgi:hypothetical protein